MERTVRPYDLFSFCVPVLKKYKTEVLTIVHFTKYYRFRLWKIKVTKTRHHPVLTLHYEKFL